MDRVDVVINAKESSMIAPKPSMRDIQSLAIALPLFFASTLGSFAMQSDIILEQGALSKDIIAVKQPIAVTNNTLDLMKRIIVECGFYNANGRLVASSLAIADEVQPKQRAFVEVEVSLDEAKAAESTECRARSQD